MAGFDQDGQYFEKSIPHHKCSKDEIAEFYPLESSFQRGGDDFSVESFNCIDWDEKDPYLLY